ncbi:MAG: hypothetical protein NTW32_01985 [Chloroflexi bacterium]|nr:hypothetical protein [Chloroflexota bacterium]
MSEKIVIEIKPRPWYEWLVGALFLLTEVFLIQNAIASSGENEPRAAMLFWVSFFVLLIVGGVVWFMRRSK